MAPCQSSKAIKQEKIALLNELKAEHEMLKKQLGDQEWEKEQKIFQKKMEEDNAVIEKEQKSLFRGLKKDAHHHRQMLSSKELHQQVKVEVTDDGHIEFSV